MVYPRVHNNMTRLAYDRVRRGWDQTTLAQVAGVSRDTISRMESWQPGARGFRALHAAKVAQALEGDLDTYFMAATEAAGSIVLQRPSSAADPYTLRQRAAYSEQGVELGTLSWAIQWEGCKEAPSPAMVAAFEPLMQRAIRLMQLLSQNHPLFEAVELSAEKQAAETVEPDKEIPDGTA